MQTTVTGRGQTAIPAKLRKKYGIDDQTKLEWIDEGDALKVIPVPKDPVASYKGKSKGKGLTKILLETRKEERKREEKILRRK